MENKTIGGQAVIEGVMMKSSERWAVAVRNPKGEIVVKSEELKKQNKLTKIPVVRGFFILIETLWLGMKAIDFSSKVVFEEEKSSNLSLAVSLLLACLIGSLLFIILPLYITKVVGSFFAMISNNSLVFNLIDGLFRIFIFIGYVFAIRLWPQMGRIFAYHGAEHKTINAYESGESLTPDRIANCSRFHVRCGTSFIFIVLIISILIFSMIPSYWSFTMKALSRVLLLPLIAGMSYEILKLSAKLKDAFLGKFLIFPGMLFQGITTREPDLYQIEVAYEALKHVLNFSKNGGMDK